MSQRERIRSFLIVILFYVLVVESSRQTRQNTQDTHQVCSAPYSRVRLSKAYQKRVIAFTLFASSDSSAVSASLVAGSLQNIADSRLYYPGWFVRFYVFDVGRLLERQLLDAGDFVEIVQCRHSSILTTSKSRKMISRFLVLDDPTVHIAIIRDADSRFSPRELFAVNQWLSSDLMFHSMRDHEYHDVPVMGGMFGCVASQWRRAPQSISKLLKEALSDGQQEIVARNVPGEDQAFLAKYVWPIVRHSTFSHDVLQERCVRYGSKRCETFPMGGDAKGFYVGAAYRDDLGSLTGHISCNFTCGTNR